MKTYRIPNTDLDVSRMAYGTWHIGGTWDSAPITTDLQQRAERMIHAAIDHGINHIDLADIYTKGKSDTIVGNVLRQQPGLRDKLILQEKTGIILGDDPNPGDPGRYDFSYDNIVGKVETSLRRLGTDYVDLLALHRPDPLVEPDEVARAFDHLQSSGKVRYFGVSNHTPMQIALLKKSVTQPLVVNQIELNLLHNHLLSEGIDANLAGSVTIGAAGTVDYCRLNDMMIQAWSPIAGGRVFNVSAESDNERSLAMLINELAKKHATTPEAIAFAWLLRHPAGIQPIIGTLRPERIATSVLADEVELSRLEWYKLFVTARGRSVP